MTAYILVLKVRYMQNAVANSKIIFICYFPGYLQMQITICLIPVTVLHCKSIFPDCLLHGVRAFYILIFMRTTMDSA